MNIKSSPARYASAVEPLLFTLEGLDPDTVTTVEIVNADNGALLGTLRLRGLATRSIDVAPFLRRHFIITPTINSATYALSHYASIVNYYIRSGEVQSETLPTLLAAPNQAPLTPATLLSDQPLRRTLAPGENDDLRFISEDCTIECSILLYDTDGGITPHTLATEEREQMMGAVIDFDSLQSRVSAPLNRIEVTLATSGAEVAKLIYDVTERGVASHRVAWFNSRGGYDLHTFEGFAGRKVSFERQRIEGSPDPLVVRHTTLSLDSGIVPQAQIEALLSLIASPSVWLIDEGRLRKVDVATNEHTSHPTARPDRITVQLSYSEILSRTC